MTWVCHLAWWTNIMLKCVYPVIILISPSSSSTWWWDKYWQSGCEGPSMNRWTSVLLLAFLLTCGSCQRLHSSKLSMIQVLAQSSFKTRSFGCHFWKVWEWMSLRTCLPSVSWLYPKGFPSWWQKSHVWLCGSKHHITPSERKAGWFPKCLPEEPRASCSLQPLWR